MQIQTKHLDQAAFFMTFKCQLVEVKGKYPDNEFVLNVPLWLSAYEAAGGWVPYNKFCNKRRDIKRKTRKLAGLPEYFTGNKPNTFKLGDIFTVVAEKHGEKINEEQQRIRNRLQSILNRHKT